MIGSKRVDGIIIFDPEVNTECRDGGKVMSFKMPAVYLGKSIQGMNVDTILIDNFDGAYMMTERVVKNHNYKRIVFITGPANSFDGAERLCGFKHALEMNELAFAPVGVFHGDFTKESGKNAVEARLKSDVNAIFASNDEMALGVIEESQRKGIKVGTGIPVVEFDDAFWSRYIFPPLTTVHQPMHSIGKVMAKTVIDGIGAKNVVKTPMKIVLNTRLILRNSCGCGSFIN